MSPADTLRTGFPYPLPPDPITDYPALGRDLAESIEALYGKRSLGTSFPAAATVGEGDEFIYVDSLTSPTVRWHFRASIARGVWEFIGGAPKLILPANYQGTFNGWYVWVPNVQWYAPKTGAYIFRLVASAEGGTNNAALFISVCVNANSFCQLHIVNFTAPTAKTYYGARVAGAFVSNTDLCDLRINSSNTFAIYKDVSWEITPQAVNIA